jgi:phosphonate transport system substrate-binding protein
VRHRVAALALLLTAALGAGSAARAQTPPDAGLRIGLVPYLSARAMVSLYQPLRQHLERVLGRTVTLYSATDFTALAENARKGEYDLALLPPHIARIAVLDWGHHFVAHTGLASAVHLLVPRNAPTPKPQDLRGRRIAAIDRLSITTLVTQRWLQDNGLVPGRDVQIEFVRSTTTAVLAVERGEADAMVAATGMLRDLAENPDSTVRSTITLGEIPTPVFVARPGLPAALVTQVRDALLSFSPESTRGGLSQAPFRSGSVRDLDRVEPYAEQARRLLRGG